MTQQITPERALELAEYFDFGQIGSGPAIVHSPDADEIAAILRWAAEVMRAETVEIAQYDAGLINDYGGGNVGWWQDYVRYEVGMANSHYQEQLAELIIKPAPPATGEK